MPNVNIGAPCLGQDGTLIVAGTGTDVRAYRTGMPWDDLLQGLASGEITPELSGTGLLLPGSPVTISLAEAAPLAASFMFIGASELGVPFKGGTLVPHPDLIQGPLVTDASGGLSLASKWPPGLPSGTELWFQMWITDAGAPHGFSASNALKATTP
jgi:hypothetical protein